MDIQAFRHFPLILAFLASPVLADCRLERVYTDERRIMQHFSVQSIGQRGRQDSSACTSACKAMGMYANPDDAAALRGVAASRVEIRCVHSLESGGAVKGKLLGASTVDASQLKPPPRSAERTQATPRSDRNRDPAPESPRASAPADSGETDTREESLVAPSGGEATPVPAYVPPSQRRSYDTGTRRTTPRNPYINGGADRRTPTRY